MDKVSELLVVMLTGFLDYPEDIDVTAVEDSDDEGDLVVLNVEVHPDDVGAAIGKGGETAKALRRIIGLVGFKELDRRVYVKINAPPRRFYKD